MSLLAPARASEDRSGQQHRLVKNVGSPLKALATAVLTAILFSFATGCANIVPPSGGPKDVTPPKLLSVLPKDSQLNVRPGKLELQFDEYITVSDAASQVQISPLLTIPLTVTSQLKRVNITIPDSLLQDETTYRITFGTAIRDLHEGNIYKGSGYTFSTGGYFDSLSISGTVHDARTGLPDSAALILLYNAKENDSAVVRRKPMYVTHADAKGNFSLEGLPPRPFRIYALRDANANLIFDGGNEWIGFADSVLRPGMDRNPVIDLRTFPEEEGDTAATKSAGKQSFGERGARPAERSIPKGSYRISADTSDPKRRTFDISQPLVLSLGRRLSGTMNREKVFLSADSEGTIVEAPTRIVEDSTGLSYRIYTAWQENTLYTLRLQKGFARDSSGTDLLPGRYTFRTKRDEDYGKLRIHLPSRYYGRIYLLQVVNEKDTIYQKPVIDTIINLTKVPPGVYSMRIIVDENQNSRWDAGDLFRKRQPEVVVPYNNSVNLKAGWEQQIDFVEPRKEKTPYLRGK